MINSTPTRPSDWYVREDTVAGPLFFYPAQRVDEDKWSSARSFEGLDRYTWTTADGAPVEVNGNYLVSTKPTPRLVATWTPHAGISHYARKPLEEIRHAAVRAMAENSPEVLMPEGDREACHYGGACGECAWCLVRRDAYEVVRETPEPKTRIFNVEGLTELPATPEPAPEWTWHLDSPQLAAVYPRRAAHLFPGYLTGIHQRVGETVKSVMAALGLPDTSVNVFAHELSVSVACSLPWDEPRQWEPVKGQSRRARETNRGRDRKARIGVHWHERMTINDRLAASSKTAALDKVTETVAQYVDKLVPPHTEVCGHCSGRGYTR